MNHVWWYHMVLLLLVLCEFTIWTNVVVAQDGRCYLRGGRSSASFTVSELLESGGVIGTLDVVGDTSSSSNTEGGDIVLSMVNDKRNAANFVDIISETKTLILKGKLDKEGVEGPSSLQVNVKCEKKNSQDPSILIPARIVVQDANDNVPNFVNTPYVLQLSEAMTPGMLITPNIVKAFDKDQPGPFSTIEYSVEPGPHSHYLSFQSAMSPVLVLRSPLDFETLPKFSITIKIQDKGQPPLVNKTTLTVHVLDADDQNPKFLNQPYTAILPETNLPGDVLEISPSNIKAEDQDRDLNVSVSYTFDSETVDSSYFEIDSETGLVSLYSAIPQDMAFPITLVVRATQVDNEDRRALTTLTVSRSALFNGLHFLSPLYHLNVPENLPVNSVLLRLQTNRPYDQHLLFDLKDNFNGQFSITNSGELILKSPLDYEEIEKMVLDIEVSSGLMHDATRIEVNVIDVNEHDPKFDSVVYRFVASAVDVDHGSPIGYIKASDSDRNDRISLTIVGANAKAFRLDKDGGLYVQNASLLNSTTAHLVVVATDNGTPPRSSSTPLEVKVPEELISIAGTFTLDSTYALVIIFGVALVVLFMVTIVLAVHIAKRKHKRDRVGITPIYQSHRPLGKMAGYMTNGDLFAHHKLPACSSSGNSPASSDTDNNHHQHHLHSVGLTNPVFHESPPSRNGHGLKPRVTCVVSASSTDETSSNGDYEEDRLGRNNRYGVHSGNGVREEMKVSCCCHEEEEEDEELRGVEEEDDDDDEEEDGDGDEEMDKKALEDNNFEIARVKCSTFLQGNNQSLLAKRSSMKVRNSTHSVPRRVKKLSWEDEKVQTATVTTPQLDPEVSVTPYLNKHSKTLEHPDLTVYF